MQKAQMPRARTRRGPLKSCEQSRTCCALLWARSSLQSLKILAFKIIIWTGKDDERFRSTRTNGNWKMSKQDVFDKLQMCTANQSDSYSRMLSRGSEYKCQILNDISLEEDPQILELLSLVGNRTQGTKPAAAAAKQQSPSVSNIPPPVRYIRSNKKTRNEFKADWLSCAYVKLC